MHKRVTLVILASMDRPEGQAYLVQTELLALMDCLDVMVQMEYLASPDTLDHQEEEGSMERLDYPVHVVMLAMVESTLLDSREIWARTVDPVLLVLQVTMVNLGSEECQEILDSM